MDFNPTEPRVSAFEIGWAAVAVLFAMSFGFYAFFILVLK